MAAPLFNNFPLDLPGASLWGSAQARLSDYLTPSVRLGVTGLARSGKTVFITALVRSLVAGGRLPFFGPEAEGRIARAFLEPQPDDAIPRFDYEAHLETLVSTPPAWPDSTRRVSQLRVTIEYRSDIAIKRALGLNRLHLDIVDYPGEWLIDLPLLDQDYASFSNEALRLARDQARSAAARPWLDFLAGTDPAGREDENIALAGARLFTDYLCRARDSGVGATMAPGRFLLPGDLEGSPLLTFFPMPIASGVSLPRHSLVTMMQRRFESYKSQVVRPFFEHHFRRLDRQAVLVDVLGAVDAGPVALADCERAMASVLQVFQPGHKTWLSLIVGTRIDRVLFAATKADQIPASSHDHLASLMRRVVERALARAAGEGAETRSLAVSAIRATRESEMRSRGEILPCLRGIPQSGERIGSQIFDGRTEVALFPGDLPSDPDIALAAGRQTAGSLQLVRFQPPSAEQTASGNTAAAFPHIRLDRALDFLIGDYLA